MDAGQDTAATAPVHLRWLCDFYAQCRCRLLLLTDAASQHGEFRNGPGRFLIQIPRIITRAVSGEKF